MDILIIADVYLLQVDTSPGALDNTIVPLYAKRVRERIHEDIRTLGLDTLEVERLHCNNCHNNSKVNFMAKKYSSIGNDHVWSLHQIASMWMVYPQVPDLELYEVQFSGT